MSPLPLSTLTLSHELIIVGMMTNIFLTLFPKFMFLSCTPQAYPVKTSGYAFAVVFIWRVTGFH